MGTRRRVGDEFGHDDRVARAGGFVDGNHLVIGGHRGVVAAPSYILSGGGAADDLPLLMCGACGMMGGPKALASTPCPAVAPSSGEPQRTESSPPAPRRVPVHPFTGAGVHVLTIDHEASAGTGVGTTRCVRCGVSGVPAVLKTQPCDRCSVCGEPAASASHTPASQTAPVPAATRPRAGAPSPSAGRAKRMRELELDTTTRPGLFRWEDLDPIVRAELRGDSPFAGGRRDDETARYDASGRLVGNVFYDSAGNATLHPADGGAPVSVGEERGVDWTALNPAERAKRMEASLHGRSVFLISAESLGNGVLVDSSALPASAIPAGFQKGQAIPAEAFPPGTAIPSNALAIPSNMLDPDVLVDTRALPASLLPRGVRPGEMIPVRAIPAEAIPAEAIPAEAIPAEAIPAEAIPSNAIPAEFLGLAIPAEAIPAEAIPAEFMPRAIGDDQRGGRAT